MGAIANIVINDGQATPVAHTFGADDISDGVAKWYDRSGGIALGFPALSFSLRSPTKTNRNYKLTLKVVVPTLEVTSPSTMTGIQPSPTMAYPLMATCEFVMSERSTQQERKNLLAYLKNALANAVITNAVNDYEKVY